MAQMTGAQIVARSLRSLGVSVIFGIVGIPVVEIAEEAINLGIKFIGFRNEQAAGYAASVYGYLTGRPGVCPVVGGPGVLHAVPGVRFNARPLKVYYLTSWSMAGGQLEHQCFSTSACRFCREPARLERRLPRARCYLLPNFSHQARSPPIVP